MPELFGNMPDGAPVHRVALSNSDLAVKVLTFGAALQSIETPDRYGRMGNIALGLDTLQEYIADSPHFGAIPGRYAGRIARGRFDLDGVAYQLPCNDGPNTLHGGPNGFGRRAWSLVDHDSQQAVLELVSPDNDAGFPGTVTIRVSYSLRGPALRIAFHAETTAPTVVNFTNHSYFNLSGEGSGSALGHELTIDADQFAPTDIGGIPTGELRDVAGTAFDFRTPTLIGARIRGADPQLRFGRGYDHGYVLRGRGMRRAAMLHDPGSGRTLLVSTTEPALQLYTGNMLTGALAGPSGRTYRQSDGICLEAQHLQDSPNHPAFPSTVLRLGRPFTATTVFEFGVAGVRQ